MGLINKSNVVTGNIIEAQDVLNIIEALDGTSLTTTLIASGNFSGTFSGSFYPDPRLGPSFSGSLFGTASWAVSASHALTASYALNAGTTGSNPGGTEFSIQFNSASAFGGDTHLKYNYNLRSLQRGTGSIALGTGSHAEGAYSTAIGNGSHAEGGDSALIPLLGRGGLAIGIASHAEGLLTTTVGDYSHAEGYNTRTIHPMSHAEGYATTALGLGSHAEGNSTRAFGTSSHAEGSLTTAKGHYSHAEGEGTIAGGNYSHVQGRFNIESLSTGSFIIGNGTSSVLRSNLVFASGSSFQITGSLSLKNTTQSGGNGNVLTYNSTTGLVTYTSSAAIGGGGGGGSQFAYEIGQHVPSQGGVIFDRWLSTSAYGSINGSGTVQNYLVVSYNNAIYESYVYKWSYNNTLTSFFSATSSWNGKQNFDKIVAAMGANLGRAFAACIDYGVASDWGSYNPQLTTHTDWFLPSINELQKLAANLQDVSRGIRDFTTMIGMNDDETDGFAGFPLYHLRRYTLQQITLPAYDIYWSSTEAHTNGSLAWIYNFTTNESATNQKDINHQVRPIRRFSI